MGRAREDAEVELVNAADTPRQLTGHHTLPNLPEVRSVPSQLLMRTLCFSISPMLRLLDSFTRAF